MTYHRFAVSVLALALSATPVLAQDHSNHAGHHPAPAPTPSPAPSPTPAPADPHAGHTGHIDDATADDGAPIRTGWSGFVTADGSGTSRLPGAEGGMHGLHIPAGDDWMVMLHGYTGLQFTDHSGPRGDDKVYATSMLMADAGRDTGWGRIQLRTMLSLEPAMDSRGYPNLFATGETSRGDPLVDRQHPHDLFMELAGRVDINAFEHSSLFVYAGLVGEPAIGPSAFMHRRSARYNPEPPITHHWFDSTHITYGVVTAGYASPHWQVEASAFRGREPDERRWNIETPKLDSWAVRVSYAPNERWLVQASTARLEEPEATHAGEDEQRTTASVHYGDSNGVSAMLAFSAKDQLPGDTLTAWLAEANWDITDHHSLFGRAENVANDELFPDHAHPLHDQRFRVSKFQIGYAWRTPVGDSPVNVALGGSVNAYAAPDALDAYYGDNPWGYTLFLRLSIGH